MTLPIPVPQNVNDAYSLSQLLRDIILRAQLQLPLNSSLKAKFLAESGDGTNAGLPIWVSIGPLDSPIPFTYVQPKTIQNALLAIKTMGLMCNGIKPESTQIVDVASSPNPTVGQVLTATTANSATWQTPNTGNPYLSYATFGGY